MSGVGSADERRVRRAKVARIVTVACATAAVWLLLAGSVEVVEVVVALAVGSGAAILGARLRSYVGHGQAGFGLWARHLPRMLVGAYHDCWTVTLVVLRRARGRPIAGRFRTIRYHVGGGEEHDVGRRVLTVFGATLQPNSYVVAFDVDADTVLVHELVPTAYGPIPAELRHGPGDQRGDT